MPWRLSSWVIVPARPFFIGRPGWVRSSAWIWLFSGCVAPNAGSLRPPWQVPGPSSGCSRPAAAPRPNRPPAERCWAAAGLARLARLVAQQPFDALRHEPLPGPHHRLRFTGPAHDLGSAAAVGGGKDNLGSPHVLLRCAAIRNDRLKPEAICSRDVDDNSCSHSESLNCFGRFGNPPNESDH